ncbi:UNVERIFIED_CONTAM: hypothetical protein H355_004760 [Colinus virginianus]|nr:hypothetical protein H355_004760 [Colinus virginianus]
MAAGPGAILKVLELLQDLDISLDILVETGIGKTVNSFRKHATAGNIAKSLVRKWKKLIPPENQSGHRGRKQNTEEDETKSSVSKEVKPSEKSRTSVLASQSSNSSSVSRKLNKQHNRIEKDLQIRDSKEHDNRKCPGSGSKHTSQENSPQAKGSVCKERASKDSKGAPEKQRSCVAAKDSFPKREKPKDASKQRDPKIVEKSEEKCAVRSETELPGGEEFEPPTKSFESYLNYDQVTKKRKRKACSVGEHLKKRNEQKSSSQPQRNSKFSHTNEGGEKVQNSADDQSETPSKKGAIMASLLTWQQVKEILTDVLLVTSLEPVVEAPQQVSEIVQFTGRRLNSKMQVYSGSKPVCLSKMLTLYELCIRVLQNNIDCRQVKMAYVTGAAKPPRNIRRQQGIHGTAGSVTQLHPTEKGKKRTPESREGNNSSNLNSTGNSGSSSSNGVTQDGKKPIKKIAPIMRKTLKALKSRAARR